MKMESYNSKEHIFGLMLFLVNVIMQFGICTMECNFHSVGPSCNFKNIAYGKKSRHDSNTFPPNYSDLANDNNISTCSYTSERHTGAAPWWNLWIPEKTTFKKLEIVTTEDHRLDFQNFEVLVFNTTEDNFRVKGQLTDGLLCYKHNASIPEKTKIEVTCDGFPYGNLIRIQLQNKTFQLVLCDFRLYEDCEDGFYGNGCEKCNENCFRSGYRNCRFSDGVCLYGCYSGWTGHYCDKECDSGKWGKNCGTECGKCDDSSTCNRITGDCPQGCSAGYKTPKCSEVCDDGYYGKNCSIQCKTCTRKSNSSKCNHLNGVCFNGCEPGYKGSLCDIECQNGTWGKNCEQPCGNCDNSTCNRYNGTCPGGCTAGYKGSKCTEECRNGYYGKDCRSQCNNRCSILGRNAICDKVNGSCLNGCDAGYKGSFCDEECEDGKWGEGCQQDCGKCLSSPCNNVNGSCSGGCAPGYKHTWKCTEECDDGSYGRHCYDNCSQNCKDVCDKKTGNCSKCKSGWKGNNCSEACSSGEWGENCLNACGKCKNEETCRKNDGICVNGCIPGYQHTDLCDEECENGTYGEACGGNCSGTCNGVCNKVNGTCDQCQAGWTGDFCENGTITIDFGFGKQGSKILKMNHVSFGLAILSFMFVLYYCITLLLKHN